MLKYQKSQSQTLKTFLNGIHQQIDIFGQPPGFTIFKKERFTTNLGFFSTLIIFSFCLLYFYFEIDDLVYRKNPSVYQYDTQLIESSEIPLLISNFSLAVSLTGLNTLQMQKINEYFQVKIKNCKRSRFFNETSNSSQVKMDCTDYPTQPCNEDHMVTESQKEYFSKIQLGSVYCIQSDYWKNNPPKLQGVVQAIEFQFIQVYITICKNSTNLTSCAPLDEIQANLKSGYYAIHFSDNLLQMNEPNQPINSINMLQQTSFSIQSSRSIFQTYKRVTVLTDDGYITNSFSSQEGLISNQWREASENYNDHFIINHNIYLDEKQSTYSRNYIKVQAILGKIGGFWNVAAELFRILVTPIIVTLMNILLVNKLFRFEINSEQQLIKDKMKVEANQKDQFGNSIIFRENINIFYKNLSVYSNSQKKLKNSQNPLNSDKEDLKKQEIQKYLTQQKQQLNLGFFNVLSISFFCRKKIKQQIQYAKQKCQQKLDVAFIINKIYELDKLKYILFTNEQLNLFNCLPKPVIPTDLFNKSVQNKIQALESQKQYKFMLEDEKPAQMKFEQAYQSFRKIQNKTDKTDIDMQLIEFLDDDLIQLFESISKYEQNQQDPEEQIQGINRDHLKYSVSNRLSNIPLDASGMNND